MAKKTYYVWYDSVAGSALASSREEAANGDYSTVRAENIGEAHALARRMFGGEIDADIDAEADALDEEEDFYYCEDDDYDHLSARGAKR